MVQAFAAVTGFPLPDSMPATADFLIAGFGEFVGSSNALCGVLAFFCLWKAPEPIRPFWLASVRGRQLLWLALVPALTLVLDPSLAHVGHLAGLLTGRVCLWLWRRPAADAKSACGGARQSSARRLGARGTTAGVERRALPCPTWHSSRPGIP